MEDVSWLSRTSLLIGEETLLKLTTKHVMVVGMGGVGSFAAEFIARSGHFEYSQHLLAHSTCLIDQTHKQELKIKAE